MGIYLTNGKYFIAFSKTGAVMKVDTIEKARNFYSVESAIEQKGKASKKTSGYYYIECEDNVHIRNTAKEIIKSKRKKFSNVERLTIYRKTKGHCYLCGDFVDFDKFEIEHRIPLAKGGSNGIENLFCSCHTCNTLKGSIAPADLMEKIKQIQLFQIKQRYGNNMKWKIIYKTLEGIM